MAITIDRTTVLKALETADRPLQRYDLVMEIFWTAGYDRATYRTVYDLRGDHSQCTRLIDTLRADGEIILLPSTEWRQALGPDFDTTTGHGKRGHYWYATRDQHTR
ncbi:MULTISPECIES: hypothetical protein [unclassified Streptomyces]|uniref:hypothetical protein n=1 Tax=unclassified Streptomyces TaxID=2593676 RepID=UPI00380C68F0